MYINTSGLILRETPYRESSMILTVLTCDAGKITVMAKGARRRGSKTAGACQLLAFSEMTLYGSRGRWTLTEARPVEMFEGLREDIASLALGSYFAELLEAVSDEDSQDPEILSLGLNGLFALSEGKKDPELVKSAFELRLMCLAGFEPATETCSVCGRADIIAPRLNLLGGTVRCGDCRAQDSGAGTVVLCPGSLDAMRHITGCERKKVFSFTLGDESKKRLVYAAEEFVKVQLDRGFGALEYYKNVRNLTT